MAKKIEDKYKILSHIDHIIQRPASYVGSNKLTTKEIWIIDDDKMVKKQISYIPSFIKIFDEVITNSVDESRREGSKLTIIKVKTDKNNISVWDNGGISCDIHKKYKIRVPEVIFGNLMSSSNYDDTEERNWAGVNGLGAKLTNVFSTEFKVSTCDGKNSFKQTFTNNMKNRTKASIKPAKRKHTEISFKPDFEKFGLEEIDNNHFLMIKKRVYDLAACNTHLKIYFNGEIVSFNSFSDYIKLYTDEFFYEKNEWCVGISLSENGFQQISFANSTETYDGGTHVDYVVNQIIVELRDFFAKKYKVDVKPFELKSHMFLFIDASIINPSFSSQTKEKLITEIKDFGFTYSVSDKMMKWILKSEIVNSILDWIEQKKNAEENKLARELNKSISKLKVDKLIDAKGRDRWKCSLNLFEGDSASAAFRKYRNPQTQGSFSLRGKFVNATDMTNQKLSKNTEAVNLMAALGLKLGHKVVPGTLRYGRIIFYTDADFDGHSIAALLINFFYKYWPELFEHNIMFRAETPIVVAINKKSKHKISFYSQSDYDKWEVRTNPDNWDIKYKKGLGALTDDEYSEIVRNPRLIAIRKDGESDKYLDIWFGKNSELRKKELLK